MGRHSCVISHAFTHNHASLLHRHSPRIQCSIHTVHLFHSWPSSQKWRSKESGKPLLYIFFYEKTRHRGRAMSPWTQIKIITLITRNLPCVQKTTHLWFARIRVEVEGEAAAVRSGVRGSVGGREEGPWDTTGTSPLVPLPATPVPLGRHLY